MDWSLSWKEFPRRKRLYPVRFYYWAVASDFLSRLMWILTISPESIGIIMSTEYFLLILVSVEVMRRGQWNLIRVENEQLNNSENFRAVSELTLPLPEESFRFAGTMSNYKSSTLTKAN
jgi:hypothetical protein